MNWIDAIILSLVGLALLTGYRRGAVMQVFSWGGFLMGLIVSLFLAPPIIRALPRQESPFALVVIGLAVLLVISFVVEALIAFAGARISRKVKNVKLRQADRVIGSVVGGLMALIMPWIVSLPAKKSPPLAAAIEDSTILSTEYAVLDTPPDLFARLGKLFALTPFPEVFAGINPALAPGVEPAPASLARDRQVTAAARLTYKIASRGCDPGTLVNGTGFPVGRDLVVTAAHVVAGTSQTTVMRASDAGGGSYPARVVYIDTDTDIAVLYAPTIPRGRLDVAEHGASRGTDGAAIGYPGGGKRTISVARVRTRTDAVGYDIYSRDRVKRQIYVLRAQVKQGNSGGPFVDTDGVVRGVVFAASSGDSEESYALTEDEIFKALRATGDRRRAVDTGDCAI